MIEDSSLTDMGLFGGLMQGKSASNETMVTDYDP